MLKVGDRVRLSEEGLRKWGGQQRRGGEGVVKGLNFLGYDFCVEWCDKPGNPCGYNSEHLEPNPLEATIDAWLEEEKTKEAAVIKEAAGRAALAQAFKVAQSKLSWGQRNPQGVGLRSQYHQNDWGR